VSESLLQPRLALDGPAPDDEEPAQGLSMAIPLDPDPPEPLVEPAPTASPAR
jgi:hypothetical protein